MLEYIPEWKKSLWGQVYLYDAARRKWERSGIKIPEKGGAPGGESIGCYDSWNKVLVVQRGEPWVYRTVGGKKTKHKGYKATWHLDVGKQQWKRVIRVDADDSAAPFAHDNRTSMSFDSVNGVCLLYHFRRRELWAHDAKAVKWTLLKPEGAAPPKHYFKGDPSYFDPERNVFVIINSAAVWVYRYKKAKGGK
jgi:hypothetical protein